MTATRAYIVELESALKELKIIVRNKFSEREAVFDHVWRGLEKEPATLEGLDSQYKLEIANLKTKVEKFRTDKKISLDVSGPQDIEVLTKLLMLRHQLARQRFIAAQLNKMDWEKIQYTLGRLRRENQFALAAYKKLDLIRVGLYFEEFHQITKKILLTLKEKNLMENAPEGRSAEYLVNSYTIEIIQIKENLIFLDSWAELSKHPETIFEGFDEPVRAIAGNVAALCEKYEELLNEIGLLKDVILHKINDTNIETQLFDYYEWLVKAGIKGTVIADTEKAAKELMQALNDGALFGHKISAFAGAADKLNRRFLAAEKDNSLLRELKKLIAFYEKFIPETEELTDQKNVLKESGIQINKAYQNFTIQLSEAKAAWRQGKEAVDKISDKLDVLTGREKSTSFLGRHWWKLLLGGAMAVAVAVMAIFFALPAMSTLFTVVSIAASIAAAAIVGIAIAATVSKVFDACYHPSDANHRPTSLSTVSISQGIDMLFESSEEETVPDLAASETSISERLPQAVESRATFSLPPHSPPIDISPPRNGAGIWYNPATWFWKPALASSDLAAALTYDEVKKNQ